MCVYVCVFKINLLDHSLQPFSAGLANWKSKRFKWTLGAFFGHIYCMGKDQVAVVETAM